MLVKINGTRVNLDTKGIDFGAPATEVYDEVYERLHDLDTGASMEELEEATDSVLAECLA